MAAVAAPVKVGDTYYSTSEQTFRTCYTITPSPLFNGSLLPTGTVNGSILVWNSTAQEYQEDTGILIAGNAITGSSNTVIFGTDQTLAVNTTIRAGNSSGASNNGANITVAGGSPGSGGIAGQVVLSGSLVLISAASPTDPVSVQNGALYYNSASSKFRFANGSTWQNVGLGGGFAHATYWDITSTTLPTSSPYVPDGFAVNTGDQVLFTALSSGNNEVYQAFISLGTITWTLIPSGQSISGAPSAGDTLYINLGVVRGNSALVYNGALNQWTALASGGEFTSAVVNDNQTSPATLFSDTNVTKNQSMIVDYSIARGSTRETGILIITNDGTNISFTQQYSASNGPAGVTFSVILSSGYVILQYTSTSTGSAGTFKWSTEEWT
jgi:hypothetical protein